jgi:hypothetical protein
MAYMAWYFGIAALCTAGITWYYSWAMLKGIESARDPSHLDTTENSWFFFFMEFRPRAILLSLAFIPLHSLILPIGDMGLGRNFEVTDWSLNLLFLPIYMSGSFLSLTLCTLFSWQFDSPWWLFCFSLVLTPLALATLYAVSALPAFYLGMLGIISSDFAEFVLMGAVPILLGLGPLITAWIYIRRQGDAWFRFEE